MHPFDQVERYGEVKATIESLEKLINSSASYPFFICLNSTNGAGEIDVNPLNEEIVREVNKNFVYYYFCIDVRDFVFQRIDHKGVATFAILPKFVCVKTYIPLGSFYEKLLLDIAGSLA